MPAWLRPQFQKTDRKSRVSLVAFSDQLPTANIEPSNEDGWPEECTWPEELIVRPYDLAITEQKDLFNLALHGHVRGKANVALGGKAARLDSATHVLGIDLEVLDAPNLLHLQAALSVLRFLARKGNAFAAWNEESHAWVNFEMFDAPHIAEPRFADWVSIATHDEGSFPGGKNVVHTLGLRQVGRPDLALLDVPAARTPEAVRAISQASAAAVQGFSFVPGAQLPNFAARGEWLRVDENGPELGIDNDVLLFVL